MYNIDEKLNEIVFKYNLDRFYPQYRKMLKARMILRRMIEDLMSSQMKTLFIGDDETIIRMVSRIANENKCAYFLNCKETELDKLEKMSWEEYDKTVMLSFFKVEYIFRWLRSHDIKYEWIYDVFELEGLCFERDFYKFCKETYENWFDNFFPGKWKKIRFARIIWIHTICCRIFFSTKISTNSFSLASVSACSNTS